MLCLGEQVRGCKKRICRSIGQHDQLARPGQHVDVHVAEHKLLGCGYVGVARADDLVDRGDGVGSERHCRDGLASADLEHSVDSGDVGRDQHMRVGCASGGRRRAGDYVTHAGYSSRYCAHEHGRRVSGSAARHVQADSRERSD